MMEPSSPPPESSEVTGKIEDLDLSRSNKLTETLLGHHNADYKGMSVTEKTGFTNHLRNIAETDRTPEMRAAAKRFLKEIEEGGS